MSTKTIVAVLDTPGDYFTNIVGLNNDIELVGSVGLQPLGGGIEQYGLWMPGEGDTIGYQLFQAPCGGAYTEMRDINDHGQMAAVCYDPWPGTPESVEGGILSFTYDQGTWIPVEVPGGLYNTAVTRINIKGQVAGFYYDVVAQKELGFVATPVP